jgi:hypothetical protein
VKRHFVTVTCPFLFEPDSWLLLLHHRRARLYWSWFIIHFFSSVFSMSCCLSSFRGCACSNFAVRSLVDCGHPFGIVTLLGFLFNYLNMISQDLNKQACLETEHYGDYLEEALISFLKENKELYSYPNSLLFELPVLWISTIGYFRNVPKF